jgi:hypothetical protein
MYLLFQHWVFGFFSLLFKGFSLAQNLRVIKYDLSSQVREGIEGFTRLAFWISVPRISNKTKTIIRSYSQAHVGILLHECGFIEVFMEPIIEPHFETLKMCPRMIATTSVR